MQYIIVSRFICKLSEYILKYMNLTLLVFLKFIVNTNTMIKNVKLEELNTKIVTAFLNTRTLKMI